MIERVRVKEQFVMIHYEIQMVEIKGTSLEMNHYEVQMAQKQMQHDPL